jgi:formate transporter
MDIHQNMNAPLPAEMASKAELLGISKINTPFLSTLALSILAGAFISLGAIFSTTLNAGTADMPYGISRLLAGFGFTLGLVLVIVGGAELFTGNNLIIMAFSSRKVSFSRLIQNWGIVYFGNFIGSLATVLIMFFTEQYTFGKGAVGYNALMIGNSKCSLGFIQAVTLGMMCNALVCLAVWLCYSARTTTDKIVSIILPITAFVAAGFEHSVANMYYIPMALVIKYWGNPAFYAAIGKTPADYTHLTWQNFLIVNLIPVTIGNIIGGAIMVGLVYWFIFLRKSGSSSG